MIKIKRFFIYSSLLTFCVLITTCSNKGNSLNYDENHNEINLFLKRQIIEFINSVEKDSLILGFRYVDYFYLVRFFEKDSIDYVSIECTINFPLFFCSDDGDCYTFDIDCMYCFVINKRNVIIMAPNTFELNQLVSVNDKRKVSLEQAILNYKEKSIPFLKPGWYPLKRFFKIDYNQTPLVLKPVFDINTYPPYKTENKMEVDIDELD
jgi:hypothetical protein